MIFVYVYIFFLQSVYAHGQFVASDQMHDSDQLGINYYWSRFICAIIIGESAVTVAVSIVTIFKNNSYKNNSGRRAYLTALNAVRTTRTPPVTAVWFSTACLTEPTVFRWKTDSTHKNLRVSGSYLCRFRGLIVSSQSREVKTVGQRTITSVPSTISNPILLNPTNFARPNRIPIQNNVLRMLLLDLPLHTWPNHIPIVNVPISLIETHIRTWTSAQSLNVHFNSFISIRLGRTIQNRTTSGDR